MSSIHTFNHTKKGGESKLASNYSRWNGRGDLGLAIGSSRFAAGAIGRRLGYLPERCIRPAVAAR